MNRQVDSGNSSQGRPFNLSRYFIVSSIVIFALATIVLGIVFASYQQRMMVDAGIAAAVELAQHLNHRLYADGIDTQLKNPRSRESAEYQEMERTIRGQLYGLRDVVKLKIFNAEGMTIYSTDPDNVGILNTHDILQKALEGETTFELNKRHKPLSGETTEEGKTYGMDLLEVYVPIYENQGDTLIKGDIIGSFEIYKNVSGIYDKARKKGYAVFAVFLLFMGILFFVLQVIVAKAARIINTQHEEIEKQTRELQIAQENIRSSINEVIDNESFHVRHSCHDLLKCWEVKKCGNRDCPSYESENLRCWQVAGTFCGGKVQGIFAQKFGDCRKCEVYKHALSDRMGVIGESFNNMMTLLQGKHLELQKANEQLKVLIDTDPLTQVGNRRSFQKRMEKVHLLSLRHSHPYSIIICDVDNFKSFNDTYGHQKGDYALISIAGALKSAIRRTDEIFRWGGEEFIIILPEQNLQAALQVGENLRENVEALEIHHKKCQQGVLTVSVGAACNIAENVRFISWENVIKEADDELYRAKTAGKNCVYPAATINTFRKA